MAQSNLAYRQPQPERSYDAQPILSPRPKLRTIEGQARDPKTQAQTAPWARTLVVMSVLVLVVMATVSVVRVSIANATVQMMQASEQTSVAIDQARAAGIELEVKHSVVNNPTRIQDNAASLGILPASQPATVQAHQGFSPETLNQMQLAADEARAAEVAALQAANGTSDTSNLAQDRGQSGAVSSDVLSLKPTAAAQALQSSSNET